MSALEVSTARGAAAGLLLALAGACTRAPPDEHARLVPAVAASAAAPSASSAPSPVLGPRSQPGVPAPRPAAPAEYVLAAGSELRFAFGAPPHRVQGELQPVQAWLAVDPRRLAAARGRAIVDLATLRVVASRGVSRPGGVQARLEDALKVLEPAEAEPTLTQRALEWLRLTPAVAPSPPPEHRYAEITLLQVRSEAGDDAAAGLPLRTPHPELVARRLPLVVSGELALQGVRAPYTARLTATFEWRRSAPESALPERIELATVEPVRVDLVAHGVLPRDARGYVLAPAAAELRSRAPSVQVNLRWALERAHPGEVGDRAPGTHPSRGGAGGGTRRAEAGTAIEAADR